MMTSPSYLKMINRRGLDDTAYMSQDRTKINDGKGAASQVADQNGGRSEGLLPTNRQASVEQGNELQNERDDNTDSHNTPNTLPTMENICAPQPISSTDTATEKPSWCFVCQYTEGGKNEDGNNPLVEAQEFGTGQLQYRIHNLGNPNHENPVPWGRFVLD